MNKHYFLASSNWVNQHTANNANVFMSDIRLTYYVHRNGTKFPGDFPPSGVFSLSQMFRLIREHNFDYAMLAINKNQLEEAKKLAAHYQYLEIKSFTDNRGDKIIIYKI